MGKHIRKKKIVVDIDCWESGLQGLSFVKFGKIIFLEMRATGVVPK